MPTPALLRHLALCALSAATLALVPPAADAQSLKVLNIPRRASFKTMDPHRNSDTISGELVEMAYSGLLKYSYLERPYKVEPDLLERMPEPSADRLTYTFTLRAGVRFSDDPCFPGGKGRVLTSDDVLYSLKRLADANVNTVSWYGMENIVAGLDELRESTRKGGPGTDIDKLELTGFRKLDERRFTLKLRRDNPLFVYAIAGPWAKIVAREAVKMYGDRLDTHPVGSGPFIMKDFERKGTIRWVKNPDYYGTYPSAGEPGDREKGLLKDAGKKLPLVDVVEMPLVEEAQPVVLRFLKGEFDWIAIDRANFERMVRRDAQGGFAMAPEFAGKADVYAALAPVVFYWELNMKDALLGANKPLRQALAHLLDGQGYIETLRNGRGRRLQSIVPLELAGSERDTGATWPAYDVAAAKKLLAQAGYPEGKGLPPLTVTFPLTDRDTRNQFDFYKARFAAAGVQLKPQFLDLPSAVKAFEGGNFQIAAYSWLADYPDAENFYQLLYGKNGPPGPNHTAWAHPGFDRAYEASRFLPNGPERLKQFKLMNDIVREEVPVLFEYNSLVTGLTQKWLSNFKRNPMLLNQLMYLDIDAARKAKGP
jgi:ABC-type transport system substrate-binding protein